MGILCRRPWEEKATSNVGRWTRQLELGSKLIQERFDILFVHVLRIGAREASVGIRAGCVEIELVEQDGGNARGRGGDEEGFEEGAHGSGGERMRRDSGRG